MQHELFSGGHRDGLIHIFSFFSWKELMSVRCVCKSWRDGVAKTPVAGSLGMNGSFPWGEVAVKNLQVLAKAIPNVRAIGMYSSTLTAETIDGLRWIERPGDPMGYLLEYGYDTSIYVFAKPRAT